VTDALDRLRALGDPARAARDRAYHKAGRAYLGVTVPQIAPLVAEWRALPWPERMALADGLWRSDIHDARVAAAKLMIQARIRPDDGAVWAMLLGWLPDFDAWAIADFATDALDRRLAADPSRIEVVEGWTADPNMWVRRAALVICQPFIRLPHPRDSDLMIRERALEWCVRYLPDRQWFIHKAIGALVRDLSYRDPERARAFMAAHGERLLGVARREAGKALSPGPSPTGEG
jgi:3-methyladenine DNA glycosylase AlkD